jgi:hypothetical protein
VRRALGLLSACAALSACKAPPVAPVELGELSRYVYRTQADDEDVVAAGIENLDAFLAGQDLTAELLDRSWTLPDLTDEDVAGVERPDRDVGLAAGVAVAYESVWPVVDHARVQSEADQTPFEPTAKEHYDRVFVDIDDPACFPARTCDQMSTVNDATRNNILMKVTFELFKDFRWVDLSDGRGAVVARSWFKEPFPGEGGKVVLQQTFSIDVWIDQAGDKSWRYQAVWSESEGITQDEGLILGTVKFATDEIFRTADEKIGELYHP